MDDEESVKIQRIGQDLTVEDSAEVVEFHLSRIKYIENLSHLKNLKKLCLVSNIIHKIENLEQNTELEHLDLYQNRIKHIENLENLTNLKVLDLSFNEIDKIENLETLDKLEQLYLSNNKISEACNLAHFKNLTLLELGSNKVRDYGDVEHLRTLNALWLGKNKLTTMSIPELPNLEKCSIQNNRVREWDECILKNLPNLREFYLSYNKLTEIPSFISLMSNLVILDLGNNRISKIHPLAENHTLEELWLNDNEIDDLSEVKVLTSLKALKVLYLERNPLQFKLGPSYRNRVLDILPSIFHTLLILSQI
ncbi:protein phosphatase regulator subunit, putative [Theileria annulata]|uniref:Protein phosphatase regulator subunit, putative n=1 Tax=Theileria annulata TaxID=5874 RepID=Q4UA18_THEAN|nr:protein phosphatase regulator subunit, putative [Theileria annulata]CAI76335.1 protein phosphatase regulator subunit, putative [Theileria annulata]|eukprot:XP_952959.1 protein phosphatase regulator subunit, putative [Theileria annulata]